MEIGVGSVVIAMLLEAWHRRREQRAWALVSESVRDLAQTNLKQTFSALAFPFISEYEDLATSGVPVPDVIHGVFSGGHPLSTGLDALCGMLDKCHGDSASMPEGLVIPMMSQVDHLRVALEELSRDVLPRLIQLRADPVVVAAALDYERRLKSALLLYTPEGSEGLQPHSIIEQVCIRGLHTATAMSRLNDVLLLHPS